VEVREVFAWLTERWLGWRLPVLFFTVKGFLGNPTTMRAHYIALDETAVADEVLTAIAGTMRAATTPPPDVPKTG
jgi:hypothetical protein